LLIDSWLINKKREHEMNRLITDIKKVKETEISTQISRKIQSFLLLQHASPNILFQELCYCILTANCPASRCLKIQEHLSEDFLLASTETLSKKLKQHGYRFPHIRAEYITTSRKHLENIPDALRTTEGQQRRLWLTHTIKGIGYKEASHFLRNIGYLHYAIIDTHIMKLLKTYDIIPPTKTMTTNTYLYLEKQLQYIAQLEQMTLGELDLYLWYMETGAILK
jgi:N-glycosylase/DNA lyase